MIWSGDDGALPGTAKNGLYVCGHLARWFLPIALRLPAMPLFAFSIRKRARPVRMHRLAEDFRDPGLLTLWVGFHNRYVRGLLHRSVICMIAPTCPRAASADAPAPIAVSQRSTRLHHSQSRFASDPWVIPSHRHTHPLPHSSHQSPTQVLIKPLAPVRAGVAALVPQLSEVPETRDLKQ